MHFSNTHLLNPSSEQFSENVTSTRVLICSFGICSDGICHRAERKLRKHAADLDIFTGSFVRKDGTLCAFDTAHNRNLRAQGKVHQQIFCENSRDGIVWEKDPTFRLTTAGHGAYRFPGACRDPFVFWNPEEDEYGMLITALVAPLP